MLKTDILESLNEPQKKAVLHKDGPLLVLAGAGSGKTRVLTHRVAQLIDSGVAPATILAVTFTNKAASEMKDRIVSLLGTPGNASIPPFISPHNPYVGTFHSLAVQILRREAQSLGYSRHFVVYDSDDQLSAVKKVLKRMGIAKNDINPHAAKHAISQAKNELLTSEDVLKQAGGDYFTERVAKIYKEYQAFLQEADALDFDDLIMQSVTLFTNNKKALERYQERFRYILIDEYQDTNKAQYEFLRLFSEKYQNLFVVGDDWQSIYGWRGADIRNILNFEKDFKNAKVIKLEQNYRSTKNILDAAHGVILGAEERKEKELWTEAGEGDRVGLYTSESAFEEAQFVADRILENVNIHGKRNAEHAVLYRTNVQSRVLEEIFLEHSIPYKIVGGVRFYDRKEIKDVVAYLRLLLNPNDTVGLLRVVNVPSRKIGKQTLAVLEEEALATRQSLFSLICNDTVVSGLRGAAKNGLVTFRNIILKGQEKLDTLSLDELIEYIVTASGLGSFLRDGSDEGEIRYENVMELKSVTSKFTFESTRENLEALLQEISLMSDVDETDKNSSVARASDDDRVLLMTVHSAKGLEFDEVFLIGMEESLFPHSRSLFDMKELDEERRLCYVGMTRAKKRLFMLRALYRELFGATQNNAPSRFLEDIPAEHVEELGLKEYSDINLTPVPEVEESNEEPQTVISDIHQGDLVMHPAFGKGVVIKEDGSVLEIAFAQHGVKKIAADFAGLKKE
ncbi:UvrD-helicase domain-containing protein [Patescibacteria group bacterium]|nr:UvrD-helicase domain-containing protein [Patescibacteria group bacterium]